MFTNYTATAPPAPGFDAVADVRQILQRTPWPIHNASAYGAVGDGVADDTAALNAVFAAASLVHGTVFLEPGKTYKAATRFTAGTNVAVVGHGATIAGLLVFGSGSRWYGVSFVWGDSADMKASGGQSVRGVDGLVLEDCAFTYTGAETVQDVGLVHTDAASAQNVLLRGCRFACTGAGVANGLKVVSKTGFSVLNWRVEACTFAGIGRMGAEFSGSAAAYGACRNVRITDCTFKTMGTGTGASSLGMGVSLAGKIDHYAVVGNHFDGCPGVSIELANDHRYGNVTANTVVNPGGNAIQHSGAGSGVVAIVGNEVAGANVYLSAAINFVVVGNEIAGALYLSATDDCTVVGNAVEVAAVGTGALILETCTDTLVSGNRISNTSASGAGALQVTNGDRNRIGANLYTKAAGVDVAVSGTGTHKILSPLGRTASTGAGEGVYGTWTAFTPTWGGFTATVPTAICWSKQVDDVVFVYVRTTVNGTSNATSFTMSLPVNGDATAAQFLALGTGTDNGVALVTPSSAWITATGTVTFYPDPRSGGSWTAANGKGWSGMFWYKL